MHFISAYDDLRILTVEGFLLLLTTRSFNPYFQNLQSG